MAKKGQTKMISGLTKAKLEELAKTEKIKGWTMHGEIIPVRVNKKIIYWQAILIYDGKKKN